LSATVKGQVLGISTILPATGSNTNILIFAIALIVLGLILKYYPRYIMSKK
jgi:LPXTG-motif cell wall-anchored protein